MLFHNTFTDLPRQEWNRINKKFKQANVPPYNLVFYFATHPCGFCTSAYYFWKLFDAISQAKAFASDSRPHLTIQCGEKKKEKEKMVPEAE